MDMFIQIIGLLAIVGAAVYFSMKSAKKEQGLQKAASLEKKEKSKSEELENSRV